MAPIAHPVTSATYIDVLALAQNESERIKGATSPAAEMPTDKVDYYLSGDRKSGYGVKHDGELIGVFSLVPGRGERLIGEAVALDGARKLDCFDGFLPDYYKQFGFVEYMREPNWTEGGPDVVYMQLDNKPKPWAAKAQGVDIPATKGEALEDFPRR